MLKTNKKESNKIYKVYICGNDSIYKIGQTSQRYLCDRLKVVRRIDKGIELYAYAEFEGSKPLAEYIEASLRLYLYNKGYNIIGNDHIEKRGSKKTFIKTCLTAITNTLNQMSISYEVRRKV